MKRLALSVVAGTIALIPSGAAAQTAPAARAEAESRYQVGQMERVLEGAVEHGATITRDRLKAVLPPADTADTLMAGENARARGFRLEGYGVFFDVIVPPFYTETTLTWSLRTLDQNDLGLDSALKELRSHIQQSGDANLQQALKRVELQMSPMSAAVPMTSGARTATGSVAATTADTPPAPADPILNDPNEAYRTEVVQALKEAMLDHSTALGIGPDESLTIAAKGNDDRPRLAPADSDARTRMIRLRGSDLADYLAHKISKEEALKRIEVRVF